MDVAHAAYQKQCAEDIARYEQAIKEAQADIAKYTPLLAEAQAEKGRLEKLLSELESNLKATETMLAETTKTYLVYKADNEARRKELREAIALFEHAKDVFNGGFKGAFLQTNTAAHLANKMKEAQVPKTYQPYVKLLIQALESPYSTKVVNNESAVSSIRGLFDRLIEQAQAELDHQREDFKQVTEAFEKMKAELEAKIQRLKNHIADVTSQIAVLKNKIATYTQILEDAQKKLKTNTINLQERTADCEAEQAKYDRDTAENNKYLEAIAQVVEIFESRVTEFTKYINESRGNVNIKWVKIWYRSEYQNNKLQG